MKKQPKIINIILTILILFSLTSCVQTSDVKNNVEKQVKPIKFEESAFPEDFKENAIKHLTKLTSYPKRHVESEEEKETVEYISSYFEQIGIESNVEKFQFQTLDYENMELTIDGNRIECETIYLNTLEHDKVNGSGVIYDSENDNIEENIIIINDEVSLFELLQYNPNAIICLKESDYSQLKKSDKKEFDISIAVSKRQLSSYNVIGTICPPYKTDKEIIISAHWDSYNGPGAHDNATGISVMLELAKYYSKVKDTLPCKIKFLATGAEELGKVGAKNYIYNHSDELKDCILLFNIDSVGGYEDIYIEMKGGVFTSDNSNLISEYSEIFAYLDYSEKWYYDISMEEYSNVPQWLYKNITDSCNELNFEFIPSNGMGSDHQVFAENNIPSTDICIHGGIKTHSPEDTLDVVNVDGLEVSGKIVSSVINKTLKEACN